MKISVTRCADSRLCKHCGTISNPLIVWHKQNILLCAKCGRFLKKANHADIKYFYRDELDVDCALENPRRLLAILENNFSPLSYDRGLSISITLA